MVNLTYLQSYAAVVSQGSFSAAAEYLQVSKGLVSRHVNNLEQQLNAQLLHRTTRVIRMTAAGEALYVEAQKIFSLANDAVRNVHDMTQEASGLLRFTAPISIGDRIMKDIIVPYQTLCPKVSLELNFSNQAFDLASGENDIALRAFETLPELVVAKSVGRVRNVLVASESYLSNSPKIARVQDLKSHNCILNSHQQAWNVWQLKRDGGTQQESVVVSANVASSKYATAKMLAEQGCGIANLPWYAVQEAVLQKKLCLVLEDYNLCVHEMAVIHAAQRQLPKKIRIFKDLLIEWFENHPEFSI